MTPTDTATEKQTFVFLRLEQRFDHFVDILFRAPETWLRVPLILLMAATVVATLVVVGRAIANAQSSAPHPPGYRDTTGRRLRLLAGGLWIVLIGWAMTAYFFNDTYRPADPVPPVSEKEMPRNAALWWVLVGTAFGIGSVYAIALYVKESRAIRWYWAALLAFLRICVYAVICGVFLLPAIRTTTYQTKASRVIVLLDVSPSMSPREGSEDEVPTTGSRIGSVIQFLTDDKVAFLKDLLHNNPVVVYRFGNELDPDGQPIAQADPAWAAAEWEAFAKYDFKPLLVRGLTDEGRKSLAGSAGWRGAEAGTPEWAGEWVRLWRGQYEKADPADKTKVQYLKPDWLGQEDADAVHANVAKLKDRIDLAQRLLAGTKVPDSLAAVLDKEAGNLVQGVIVFSDGRSQPPTTTAVQVLKKAATEGVPVFTVLVGEDEQIGRIRIAGIQTPDTASPDEAIKVVVDVDGQNLAGQTVPAVLDVWTAGKDPKKEPPDFTLDDQRKKAERAKSPSAKVPFTLTFRPGDPPSGQVQFAIDPAELDDQFTVDAKGTAFARRVLKEGVWSVRVRIPKHEKEITKELEHTMFSGDISVIEKPLRVLLFANAAGREYQALRDLFVREMREKRAVLCIRLQNEGGNQGDIVQDVPAEQLLTRFPSKLDVTAKKGPAPKKEAKEPGKKDDGKPEPKADAERFDNLNEYDVIVAVDPDWTELSPDTALNVEKWVKEQGGGLILVAGPIKTPQLARIELGKGGAVPKEEPKKEPADPADPDAPMSRGGNPHLLPILNVLPVIPDDSVVHRGQGTPRTLRRLYLHPPAGSELLKLDERPELKGNPLAGWELYFTDGDGPDPANPESELTPHRGFYQSYPVMTQSSPNPVLAKAFRVQDNGLKPAAKLLAEFVSVNPQTKEKYTTPWLAILDKVGEKGRTAFMGSDGLYRMQGYDKLYYERFWLKLMKYLAATRDAKAARGRILTRTEYISNRPLPVLARILDTDSTPYAKIPDPKRPDKKVAEPRFRLVQMSDQDRRTKKPVGEVYPLRPRDEPGGGFDGYYTGEFPPDPTLPAEGYTYQIVIDLPDSGDPPQAIESKEFRFRKPNPEMDNTKPDDAALVQLASPLDRDFEAQLEKAAPDVLRTFRAELPKVETKLPDTGETVAVSRLAFRLDQPALVGLIPKCLTPKPKTSELGSKEDHLWDRGFEPPEGVTNWIAPGQQRVSYVLLGVVFLLAVEWMTRKLLRLA